MIDSIRHVSTPEGVELELRAAGVYARGAALLVDVLIGLVATSLVLVVCGILGSFGLGIGMIVAFLINWFYPVYFEVLHQGATPGKRMYGICVVNGNGTPVAWDASLLRNLLRFADLLPTAYFFGIVMMMCDRSSRRLGDLAADTLVVYRDGVERMPKVEDVDPVMPSVPLHQHEQRAILEFAERRRSQKWTPKRQQELANILEPLTGECDEAGVTSLAGIATYLVKGR